MTLDKNIIDQKAIKKTNKNIRNPRNFIIKLSEAYPLGGKYHLNFPVH